MTREEENRKLARWLGWSTFPSKVDSEVWCERRLENDNVTTFPLPDFRTDEAANAMLLEKMPLPVLRRLHTLGQTLKQEWSCTPDCTPLRPIYENASDRKTAIVLAALALCQRS